MYDISNSRAHQLNFITISKCYVLFGTVQLNPESWVTDQSGGRWCRRTTGTEKIPEISTKIPRSADYRARVIQECFPTL